MYSCVHVCVHAYTKLGTLNSDPLRLRDLWKIFLIFACLVFFQFFSNEHALFCNNKKNKLFKNINKSSKILGKHHMFCLNWQYPGMKGQGLAWLVAYLNSSGWWGKRFSRVASGDIQTEEPAGSRPFQETKSTAIRWVARELTEQKRQRQYENCTQRQKSRHIHLFIHWAPTLGQHCAENQGTGSKGKQGLPGEAGLTAQGLLGCGSASVASRSPRRIAMLASN